MIEPAKLFGQDRSAPEASDEAHRKLHRYTVSVTVWLILVCNSVFLLGIWGSGVHLESIFRTPDLFNAAKDVCVRQGWQKVAGADKPVRVCSEWINLSDPSGETHKFQRDTPVVKGADGHFYFDRALRADYRFFIFAGFVAVVVVSGIAAKRYLIARYRAKLGLAAHQQ
jgi:hypothetical protein